MKSLFLIFVLQFVHVSVSAAEVVKNLTATYTIPTDSEDDLPFSTYNLDNYQVILSTDNVIEEALVKYVMPDLMLGDAQEITMKLIFESDGTKFLVGSNSIAICTGKWITMKCDVRFNNITVNLEKVQNNLSQAGMDSSEVSKRISILSKFSGDPIGVSQVIP